MTVESRHLSVLVDRPAAQVYEFVVDPQNLPAWAAGLAGSIELVDGRWVSQSPMGPVEVAFAEHNVFGVADHVVTLPTGQSFYNPLRVILDGPGCEVVFSLRRAEGTGEDEWQRDIAAVQADLERLKTVAEALPAQ